MNLPSRLLSIDVFRAITMLLMIFVNDAAGISNVPEWLGHVDGKADGMGFADSIFPAFLFIVGLSLPFALKSRMGRGDSTASIAVYILIRGAALIIMGFFHVNMESYPGDSALISRAWWTLGITVSFFLIWLDYPAEMLKARKYTLISLGILLLAGMAYIYQLGSAEGMRPSWWGILGIIGWAYLVCAFIYLLAKGKLPAIIAAFAVLIAINILNHMDMMPFNTPVVGNAASAALIMAGAVISGIYSQLVKAGKEKTMWTLLFIVAIMAVIAGFAVRPYADGISKIRATPAWVLIMIGISILIFELMIYLVDVKNKQGWFKIIRPAGTSTLTCYLIPYILSSLMRLAGIRYPEYLREGVAGLIRCFLVALLIIVFVGFLEKRRLRLKV